MADAKYFATAAVFGAWLRKNASSASELLVGFHKVGSGRPSMTWSESVDEALCHGWIDGVRRSIDATAYSIRFTPRKSGSIWSAVNIAKVAQLQAAGRMAPAGLEAFGRRQEHRSRVYSFEQEQPAKLPAPLAREFKRHAGAWNFFQAAPPGYRKVMLHWVASAKRTETQESRFAQLLGACLAGERVDFWAKRAAT